MTFHSISFLHQKNYIYFVFYRRIFVHMRDNAFFLLNAYWAYISVTLSFNVSSVFCVYVCCVCVHWGWGMWVGKILKMEPAFVRALLRLIAKTDEATLLTSHKALFPRVAHTSHLSNQQVNHCGAGVRQSTERPLQTAILTVIYIRKSMAVCLPTVSSSCLFVSSVNVSPPRGVGVFIRLPAEMQPPRKKVT